MAAKKTPAKKTPAKKRPARIPAEYVGDGPLRAARLAKKARDRTEVTPILKKGSK